MQKMPLTPLAWLMVMMTNLSWEIQMKTVSRFWALSCLKACGGQWHTMAAAAGNFGEDGPNRTRGQWGEPYGVTVHKKRGVLIIHSIIQDGVSSVRALQWSFLGDQLPQGLLG
jgi:hypothetical protein